MLRPCLSRAHARRLWAPLPPEPLLPAAMIVRLLVLVLASLALAPAPAHAQRAVAVTLDDLPFAGGPLGEAVRATDALLAALAAHGVSADVFVVGARVEVDGEVAARRALLRRWRDAGHALQNHSYSHPRYSETDVAAYLADVERGHEVVAGVLAETPAARGGTFFRAPFNDLGRSAATRAALQRSLAGRGARLAPFTVEHGDWMFNAVYTAALDWGDDALARRVAAAYLAQLDVAFAFAERLSAETFGREVPQVFLLHANRINADVLGDVLARLERRGYAFVTMDEAVADPAYATADGYTAHWGVSWLHRWRAGLGLPARLRGEPEPPAWLVEAYEAL